MAGIWELSRYDREVAEALQKQLGIPALSSALLVARGICDVDQADCFLNAGLDNLSDPLLMLGVIQAKQRIERAIESQEKVVIYGDYDVDGICSIVILSECLQQIGCLVDYYVPDRFTEGYGLNIEAVRSLVEYGYSLMITVDCGISSVDEVSWAMAQGMDIIITDHHTPPAILPEALAVINPKIGSPATAANLAGAGVAFKLASALVSGRDLQAAMQEWLVLAALATVADMVPLRDENRIIVKYGLQMMQDSQRVGLLALIEESGLAGQTLKAWQLGFILGPRLNAAGRLDTARISIELLMQRDLVQAREQARQLGQMNSERRRIEDEIFCAALAEVKDLTLDRDAVLIVGGEGWNLGVVGIVASRLLALYDRPAIVISWSDGIGKGSARSVDGFDLYLALESVGESLISYGGHKMAAGLSLYQDNLEMVRSGLGRFAAAIGFEGGKGRRRQVDLEIEAEDITPALLKEIDRLEPFGEGNPVPAFVLRGQVLRAATRVGVERAHLRMRIGAGNIPGIAFNQAQNLEDRFPCCAQDVLFELDENVYQGKKTIQLKVRDIKSTLQGDDGDKLGGYPTGFQVNLERAAAELTARRPVVFVYPTYRSQVKHQAAMDYWFPPETVVPIHGQLWPEERFKRMELLKQGLAGLYMMTVSILGVYLATAALPANVRFIMLLEPEGCPGHDWELPGQIESARLGISCDFTFYARRAFAALPGRTLVYANRPGTVKRLREKCPGVLIETGLPDMRQRLDLRRKYWSDPAGTLVSDGTHTAEWSRRKVFDELILADSPFGAYELWSLLAMIGDAGSNRLGVAYDRPALDANRQFLDRSYPAVDLVNRVWSHLLHRLPPGNHMRIQDFIGASAQGLNISKLEVIAALHLLADLNLCHIQKRSSIMAINRGNGGNHIDSLDKSPYFQEGEIEKRVFNDWAEILISDMEW